HEYAHALLEAGSSGLSIDGEGQAFHEGWADYWAGSYMRFLADSQTGKRTDWQNVFRWDSGDGQIWPGRSLTRTGRYPDDTTCDDPNDANGDGCVIHSDGLLWATTLMEIYTDVGKTVMDRLALQSHAYLSAPMTFVDAAEALVQADRDLYGGIHTSVLIQGLSNRGFLDASNFGPVVSHEPLRSTEQLGETRTVLAQVVASSSAVQSVVVKHRVQGQSTFETLALSNTEGDDYSGDLSLPLTPSTIEYYVEAVDVNSIQSRLPANAPSTLFEFDVGPDTQGPTISHIPISSASNALWPVPVVTTVDDNLGVDSVWVNFTIEDEGGTVYRSGSFGLVLAGNEYRASFPVPVAELQVGSTVRYSITARDAAAAGNRTDAPASGTFNFPIVFSGVLATFDFETGGGDLVATGAWERGTPSSTLLIAHSGTGTWGTDLDAPYPAFGQISTLTLPEFNLSGLANAYLVFWHWYDFEYRGEVGPGVPVDGTLWDGGNVKVSTDGGSTWTLLQPESGYSGVIAASVTNPLTGEPAFGGYSFGWRREIIELPTANGMQFRFDFGTDESNLEESVGFGGWFIDDIALLTERPTDQTAPVLSKLPPQITLRAVGQTLPSVDVTLTDDTGVASVYVDYTITGSEPSSGMLPLAMALDDLGRFEGSLPAGVEFAAGDRFEYRIVARDFDGNQVVGPPAGQEALAIEFRSLAGTNVLRDVVATGQWARTGSVWTTTSGESATPVSSLVLPPVTLAHEVADVWVQLEHSYELGDGLGGNLSFSVDDGRTWSILEPEGGY
ncbi:MAG: hypothetical protein R3282_04260, partial [Rhodothermales bacterium]|nr:hypothetical protein [Rhodothermales bacterium]